jgi:InsA N-terminal domain
MVLIAVTCPNCQSDEIAKRGKTDTGKQRYRCHNPDCSHPSFPLNPAYEGRLPEIKRKSPGGCGMRSITAAARSWRCFLARSKLEETFQSPSPDGMRLCQSVACS